MKWGALRLAGIGIGTGVMVAGLLVGERGERDGERGGEGEVV